MARRFGHAFVDWRNGATLVATVFLLLIGYVVLDGSHISHQALSNQRHTSVAASRRIDLLTGKIDDLQTELDKVLAATSDTERQAVVAEANARRAATAAAFAQAATVTTTTTAVKLATTTTTSPATTTTTQKPAPTTTTTGSTTTTTAPRRRCVLPGVSPGCLP